MGEDIWAGGSHNDPGGINSGWGAADHLRYRYELDPFQSHNDPQQDHGRWREHGLSVGAAPIHHRPANVLCDSNDASATNFPPLGLGVDAGFTKDDAMGLMEALSDNE